MADGPTREQLIHTTKQTNAHHHCWQYNLATPMWVTDQWVT